MPARISCPKLAGSEAYHSMWRVAVSNGKYATVVVGTGRWRRVERHERHSV